ncbi:unnamed protein product [Enterobius vermicularis]|uniref:Saposin B-type domain-containing protein n=1 Tax=Enterobius vermicularis TaxID=51028 RepID=A0A0N4UX37_ENTVE|nr:unnamed protein product [Enterobius vermicularis]
MLFKFCLLFACLAVAYGTSTKILVNNKVWVTVPVDARKAAGWQCTACGVLYNVVMVAEDLAAGPLTAALETACAATGPAAVVCEALVPFVVGAVEQYGKKLTHDQLCKKIIKAC